MPCGVFFRVPRAAFTCGALPGETVAVRRMLAVMLSGIFVVGCQRAADPADSGFRFVERTPVGTTISGGDRLSAPDLSGTLVGGGEWRLAGLRGRVVVLNFWYPNCGPCRVETPELDQLARTTRSRGVDVVGIAVRDTEDAVVAFRANYRVSYPSVYDPQGRSVQQFRDLRVPGFPFTVVVDRQGRVAGVYIGALLRTDLEPVIAGLSAER